MLKIDCHSHYFEPEIAEGISRILKEARVPERESFAKHTGRPFLNAEERVKVMDRDGADMSTIEYHIVWQHYDQAKYPAKVRARLSSFLNERLAAAQERFPDRFIMMADIPFMDIEDAVAEVNHARELGTRGLCLNTSIDGRPLTAPQFAPFWEEVNRYGIPCALHPLSLLSPERTSNNPGYHPMVGYPFDTTTAGIDLLLDGFFEKYPKVRIMLAHCGGALPFIKRRIAPDHVAVQSKIDISRQLDRFYYDTAISFDEQLEFTIRQVGIDRMCYGSDYPYWDFRNGITVVEQMNIPQSHRQKIFEENPRTFFGLK